MEKFRKALSFIGWYLFITWISYQLAYAITNSNNANNEISVGGFLTLALVTILKLIAIIILFIPYALYIIYHVVIYSTIFNPSQAPYRDIYTLYIIGICAFLWFVLGIVKSSDNKVNKKQNEPEKNIIDNKYQSIYPNKNKISNNLPKERSTFKPIVNSNTLISNYNSDDDSDDDSASSTNADVSDADTTSANDSYDEDDNNSVNNGSGLRLLPTDCPDCDYPGNGKCSDCHGSGYESNVFDAVAESLSGQNQDCKTCHVSGKCQNCNGRGYFNS